MEKPKSRGRPPALSATEVEDIILSYGHELIVDGCLISKLHSIWKQMAVDCNNRKLASGFYSHVADNRNGIKDKLLKNHWDVSLEKSSIQEHISAQDLTLSTNELDSSEVQNLKKVMINFTYVEFQALLEQRTYRRTEKNRPTQQNREYTVFKPSEWQFVVTDKLWAKKIHHGYHFKTHKISHVTNKAYFQGRCQCGSEITGDFDDITRDDITVTCTITPGTKGVPCGKRYCRAPERVAIGKLLTQQNKAVAVYRAEQADKLMEFGDHEPPQLYNANVLRVVKQQHKQGERVHKAVMTALEILQMSSLANVIHGFGLNPFFLHYWTHYQLDVYRNYCKVEYAPRICLDATGKIVRFIERLDKTKTKVIFLYECVVHTGTEQFSVSQMITEAHNTNNIQFWLMEWLRSGAPTPKEIVVDSSIALLTASIRVSTGYRSIDEYANACTESTVPTTYVRIDVAHYLKMYADFLKGCRPRIKRFFLAAIGLLIMSDSKQEAEKILTLLLTVARSETEGSTGNLETLCEGRKRRLQHMIIGFPNDTIESVLDSIDPAEVDLNGGNPATVEGDSENDKIKLLPNMQDSSSAEDESESQTSWKVWGMQIDNSVQAEIKNNIGDRDNAHFLPRLADRLVKDVKWLPLWSCVCRNTFGFGRAPASSACVESDFNNLKSRVLKNESLPMRADDFVSKHIKYLNGRTKLIASANESQNEDDSRSLLKHTHEVNEMNNSLGTPNAQATFGSLDELPLDDRLNLLQRAQKLSPEKISTFTCLESGSNGFVPNPQETRSSSPLANSSPLETLKRTDIRITSDEKIPAACIACSRGNYPGDAHTCIFCKKSVHILPGCSIVAPDQEEGYGQKRICAACNKHHLESVKENIASNEVENWRGLAIRKPIRGRYLQPNFQQNELLLHEKLVKVPILRNGNQMMLNAIKLGNKKVTLSNTCSFDSVFQIFLSATLDCKNFYEACGTTVNDFLTLVRRCAKTGVNSRTYRQRAIILAKLGTVKNTKCGVDLIDCQMTVGGLCCQIFKKEPSLTEIIHCPKGCPDRRVLLPRIQVDRTNLQDTLNFTKAIEESVRLDNRSCGAANCTSDEPPNVVIEPGSFLIIELSSAQFAKNTKVQLQDIPIRLILSFSEEEYRLVGAVHFIPPLMARRSSEEKGIGHYVGISHRRDQSWVLYDDTQTQEKILTSKYKALVEILLYVRK